MFDEKKRRDEIKKAIHWFPNLEQSYDEIISQEKSMIEPLESRILYLEDLDNHQHYGDKWLNDLIAQAKKEAVKEFADKLKDLIRYAYYDDKSTNYLIDCKEYDKLLKEYEEVMQNGGR